MNNVHFAIPEIYGDSLSYYEVLRELIMAMNVIIDNYDTIPEQIADAVKNLDAAQLFSAVLNQLIDTIATDNTKSTNAVKVYKKHDLLYATFNETVNLYESMIDFTPGTETELIIGTNIREVNISELFIELRKLIDDEAKARNIGDTTLQQADTTLQQNINAETSAREQADTTLQQSITAETSAREQGDTTLRQSITAETSAREQGDTTLQQNINTETTRATDKETELKNYIDGTKTSVLNEIKAWVNDTQHPIGSIYITTTNVSPSSIFGGTWEQLKDRFLIGAGSSYSNGDTGGAASHTHTTASHVLTIEEIPEHGHGYKLAYGGNDPVRGFNYGTTFTGNFDDSEQLIANNGGGQAHSHGDTGSSSNMPPYLCVYMWKRIS